MFVFVSFEVQYKDNNVLNTMKSTTQLWELEVKIIQSTKQDNITSRYLTQLFLYDRPTSLAWNSDFSNGRASYFIIELSISQ